MNWKQLKDFCNNLPESELEKNVVLWSEVAEDSITDISAEQLKEDYFVVIDSQEDGCIPESECLSFILNNSDDYPDGMEHFLKVYDKGHPILNENF
jgi:hypothetical protein